MSKKNSAGFTSEDDVFARTANSYDMLCDLFSLYLHRVWKSRLAEKIIMTKGDIFLDIAAGTGDIALRVAINHQNTKKIILGDLCPKMLAVAKNKALKNNLVCEFETMNAHNLSSIQDNSVDIISISFAMKICERDKVLIQALRVLKPGGTFYCLEVAQIPIVWLHKLYLQYMNICVPLIATIVTKGDKSAYNYLLKGIKEFPSQEELKLEIEKVGFTNVKYKNMTLGIVSLHSGEKLQKHKSGKA